LGGFFPLVRHYAKQAIAKVVEKKFNQHN